MPTAALAPVVAAQVRRGMTMVECAQADCRSRGHDLMKPIGRIRRDQRLEATWSDRAVAEYKCSWCGKFSYVVPNTR